MATLKGITWDHPRGYRGLEIATDAFMRLRPDITVEWDRHSLHHFEFHPVPDLAATYDLIVLDHPCIGDAVSGACLLDLSQFSEALELDNLAQDVVGRSLETYRYEGRHGPCRSTRRARWPSLGWTFSGRSMVTCLAPSTKSGIWHPKRKLLSALKACTR